MRNVPAKKNRALLGSCGCHGCCAYHRADLIHLVGIETFVFLWERGDFCLKLYEE